jgi:mannose-6-phosphate isomerase-like protein (cupin superfamily)
MPHRTSDVVSPKALAAGLQELFSPRVIAAIDDTYIKVVRAHGSLAWHTHENEDEAFLVLKGHLSIELDDRTVELDEGDLFVVKKGVRHNPIAHDECHLLLIERASTQHTGDIITDKTRSIEDQLRPLGE